MLIAPILTSRVQYVGSQTLVSSTSRITAIAFNIDNTYFALSLNTGEVRIYSVAVTSTPFTYLKSFSANPNINTYSGLRFSKNTTHNSLLFSGDSNGILYVYDAMNGATSKASITGNPINFVFINELDTQIIAGGSSGTTIYSYSGSLLSTSSIEINSYFNFAASAGVGSYDDSTLVVLDNQGVNILQKNPSQNLYETIQRNDEANALRCQISNDNSIIVYFTSNSIYVYKWQPYQYSLSQKISTPSTIYDIYLSSDTTKIYATQSSGSIIIY